MVTNLIIIGVTSLLPATAVGLKGNTSLGIFNSDIFNCKIGKQYFDTAKNKCQRCPQCPKARNFRNYVSAYKDKRLACFDVNDYRYMCDWFVLILYKYL